MEEAFLRRAERLLAQRAPAALEYDVLIAALSAQPARAEPGGSALAELLSAGEGWRDAVVRQRGRFSAVGTTPGKASDR